MISDEVKGFDRMFIYMKVLVPILKHALVAGFLLWRLNIGSLFERRWFESHVGHPLTKIFTFKTHTYTQSTDTHRLTHDTHTHTNTHIQTHTHTHIHTHTHRHTHTNTH